MKKILNILCNYLTIILAVSLFFLVLFGSSYILSDSANFDEEDKMGWILLLILSLWGIFIFSIFYLIFLYILSRRAEGILYNKKYLFLFILLAFSISFFISLGIFESILSKRSSINLFFWMATFNAFIFFLETLFYTFLYRKYFRQKKQKSVWGKK